MTKINSKSQNGRSMVEMLGVLAIIGVLSVGGVYGYGVAMKKHKANEALHKASMLATTVSAYAMSNDGNLPSSIADFANLGYATELTDDGTQFKLTLKDLDDGVCEQLQNLQGGMMRKAICNGTTATLSYYKNLATNDEEGKNSPTGGSSNKGNAGATKDDDGAECSGTRPGNGDCSVCLSTGESTAHWYDSDALCTEPGQTCVDGTCVTSAVDDPDFGSKCKCLEDLLGEHYCGGNYETCRSDADCAKYGTWDSTQEKCIVETFCTNNSDCSSDEYCHYSSVDSSTCKPNKKGTCVAKADAKGEFSPGTTAEADGFIRSSAYMDWFSAQNFCRSYNKNLVTLSQMGLGSAVPSRKLNCFGTGSDACNITSTEWLVIREKFGSDFYPWTANLVPEVSCNAFFVGLYASSANVNFDSHHNDYYALCK